LAEEKDSGARDTKQTHRRPTMNWRRMIVTKASRVGPVTILAVCSRKRFSRDRSLNPKRRCSLG